MEQCALDFMDYVHLAQLRLSEMYSKSIITSIEYENAHNKLDESLQEIGINTSENDF